MIKLMKLDGSDVHVEPRTITRLEREGQVTRVTAGIGPNLLVVETPAEIEERINAETLRASTPTV